jgi:hypothetical protein
MINHMMNGSQGEHSIITDSQGGASYDQSHDERITGGNIVLSLVHIEEHHMINHMMRGSQES